MSTIFDWHHIHYTEVTSTNDIAKEQSRFFNRQNVVFTADSQTSGRGRRGRQWISLKGNLFLSQLLSADISISNLTFVASLSIAETLCSLTKESINIKWPNDVLVNGDKICGILIESVDNKVIIGVGVNLVFHPETSDIMYSTTDLRSLGYNINPNDFLVCYLQYFDTNFQLCRRDFSQIRQKWLNFAANLNMPIEVRYSDHIKKGIFKGIDEQGLLLLEQKDKIIKIAVGDIFL